VEKQANFLKTLFYLGVKCHFSEMKTGHIAGISHHVKHLNSGTNRNSENDFKHSKGVIIISQQTKYYSR
jgi:hypothetical protein